VGFQQRPQFNLKRLLTTERVTWNENIAFTVNRQAVLKCDNKFNLEKQLTPGKNIAEFLKCFLLYIKTGKGNGRRVPVHVT
jgi:hypothetical protein